MRYLVTGNEMKDLDGYSIRTVGIPSMVLMERAAHSVVEEIRRRRKGPQKVLILCGSGNNGADGLAMARMMTLEGDAVDVRIVGNRAHGTEEWKQQLMICENLGIRCEDYKPLSEEAHPEQNGYIPAQTGDVPAQKGHIPCHSDFDRYDILVDSLLGTGLSREVGGAYKQVIEEMNRSVAYVAAVDIPSGISADNGAVLGTAVKADLTVTFEFQKLGLCFYPGAEYAGECVVRSIGIVPQGLDVVKPHAFTTDSSDPLPLPVRPAWSNKGTFGRVLLIAGSRNMAGASILAGEAACRMGAGLVRIYTPECNRVIVQTALPEAILTTWELPETDDCMYGSETESAEAGKNSGRAEDELCMAIQDAEETRWQEMLEWATALVIGPGLSKEPHALAVVSYVLGHAKVPMVIDADGLNIISGHPELAELLDERCVLTPHMGEMSRLTGKRISQLKADPLGSAGEYANGHRCVVVQKDARTVIAEPEEQDAEKGRRPCHYVNLRGTSGMSTGGSGDVLAGIIGSLLAQKVPAFEAAWAGVRIHAEAGEKAAEKYGERAMLARNIVEFLS